MTAARIERQAVILFASDLRASIDCWRDKFGFAVHGLFGEPPEFAIMERDNAFVMLKQAPAGYVIRPHADLSEGLWNAYFWVDDVQAFFDDLRGRGAVIHYDLYDQPYDVREFAVEDPDRQTIGFGQVLAARTE